MSDKLLDFKLIIPPELAAAINKATAAAAAFSERLERLVWLDGLRTGFIAGVLLMLVAWSVSRGRT